MDSARAAGLEVTVQAERTEQLPAAVDLTAYRIVQEALTNAIKHAAGSSARVTVRREGDVVVVEVTNNLTTASSCGTADGTEMAIKMDVRMPGTDGIEATRELVADGVCEVLVLTTFDLDEYVHAALRAGAAGFLPESVEAPRLIDSVRLVA